MTAVRPVNLADVILIIFAICIEDRTQMRVSNTVYFLLFESGYTCELSLFQVS